MGKTKSADKKHKYSLEFEVKSSPKILFNYISTASGLESWFADRVNVHDWDFVFHWGHTQQRAKQVSKRENQMVRYKWITDDHKDETYFQFDIQQDDITGDIALIITDFTTDDEKEEDTLLWDSQVHELMRTIGS